MAVLIALMAFCLKPLLIVTRNSTAEIIPLSNFLLEVFLLQSSRGFCLFYFITELIFQEGKCIFFPSETGSVLLKMNFCVIH